MTNNQKINCPNCQSEIIFDTYALLQGVRFTCANCQAQIGLCNESKGVVGDAMNKFEQMKRSSMNNNKSEK